MSKSHPLSQSPKGFKISSLLQAHMCRIGSKLPFEEVAEELYSFLEVCEASGKQIERLRHHYGEELEEESCGESSSLSEDLTFKEDDYRYVMGDGSMLLTREDGWKEIKVACLYAGSTLVEEVSKNRNKLQESHYMAHFGHSNDFWENLNKSLINVPSEKTVFIGDGAKWWWNPIEDHYGDSIQVLDYFHCKSHVCAYASLYFQNS